MRPQHRAFPDGSWLVETPDGRPDPGVLGRLDPGAEVNPVAVEDMAEVGIDISGAESQHWIDEMIGEVDVVVTMGCGDACPVYPNKRYLDWELDDPAGCDLTMVRGVRDEIGRRVDALLADMTGG